MSKKRRYWTDKEIRTIVRMFRRGKTDSEIALKLERTERSVSLKRYALGLRHEACPTVNRKPTLATAGRRAGTAGRPERQPMSTWTPTKLYYALARSEEFVYVDKGARGKSKGTKKRGLRPWATFKKDLVPEAKAILEEFFASPHVSWSPVGPRKGNSGVIGVSTDPMRAFVERIVNSIDALLMRAKEEGGYAEEQNVRDAVKKWLGVPHEALIDMSDHDIRERLAKLITVRFWRPDSGARVSQFMLDIRDMGIGLAPAEVPHTIVGLNDSLKIGMPYVVGQFGQGAAATFRFGEYAIIVTRKFGTSRVSLTVVKEEFEPGYKAPIYYYMLWDEEIAVLDIPEEEFPAGTLVRHIGYAAEEYRAKARHRSLYGAFNYYLFDSPWPCFLENYGLPSCRAATSSVEWGAHRTIKGSRNALVRARDQKTFRGRAEDRTTIAAYDRTTEWLGTVKIRGCKYEVGSFTAEYFVIDRPAQEGKKKKSEKKSEEFVKKNHPVVFTVNGVAHGSWTRSFIATDLNLPSLEQKIIVHVNCDSLTMVGKNLVVSSTREALCDNSVTEEIRRRLLTWLGQDDDLRRLNREFLARSIKGRATRMSRAMQNLAKSYLEKLGIGDTILKRGTTFRPPKPEIEIVDPPTSIRWSLGANELEFVPGRQRLLQFETNAPGRYWDPDNMDVSSIVIKSEGVEMGGCTMLKNGRARVRFVCPEEAVVGSTGEIRVILKVGDKRIEDRVPVIVVATKVKGEPPEGEDTRKLGRRIPEPTYVKVSSLRDEVWKTAGFPEDPIRGAFSWLVQENKFIVYWSALLPEFQEEWKEYEAADPNVAESFENFYKLALFLYCAVDASSNYGGLPTVTNGPLALEDSSVQEKIINTRRAIAHKCVLQAKTWMESELSDKQVLSSAVAAA